MSQCSPEITRDRPAERHECVQFWRTTRLDGADESRVDERRNRTSGNVDNCLTDRDADPWRRVGTTAFEDAEWEILNRKVCRRVVRRLDPRFERRVVRVIETHTEVTNRNSSTGS